MQNVGQGIWETKLNIQKESCWFSKDNEDKIVIPSQEHVKNTNS